MRIIEVVEHNNAWEELFKKEVTLIFSFLGDELIQAYHIGSTAIPNIVSKPVIDIILEVYNIEKLDKFNQAFEKFGYEVMG